MNSSPSEASEVAVQPTANAVQKEKLLALLPTSMGLMITRSAMIAVAYNGYSSTDAGIFTDGATFIALLPLAIALVYLGVTERIVPKAVIFHITRVCIIAQAACTFALAYLEWSGSSYTNVQLALDAIAMLSSWLCVFYWLRRCRGTSCLAAVFVTLGAMIVSETLLCVVSFAPRAVECLFYGFLILLQFPLAKTARKRELPASIQFTNHSQGYFHLASKNANDVRFLAIIAVGCFVISIAIGLLKGYPDGSPIEFSPITRIGYALVCVLMFAALTAATYMGKGRPMSLGVWIAMQALGAVALVLFAAFPNALDIGAMFGNAMNSVMTGFMFYLVIAFSSYGHRDTYYYAIGGWMVYLLPRSITRIVGIASYGIFQSTALSISVCAGLLLLSAQFIFLQFLALERTETEETKAVANSVQKLLGIKQETAPGAEMRRAIIEESARSMQKQFLLSDRETEVLTLYAMGLTQAKIAEKLCIAQGTAHTHIKRIYAKTDLHSRQAVLDYIEQYTE